MVLCAYMLLVIARLYSILMGTTKIIKFWSSKFNFFLPISKRIMQLSTILQCFPFPFRLHLYLGIHIDVYKRWLQRGLRKGIMMWIVLCGYLIFVINSSLLSAVKLILQSLFILKRIIVQKCICQQNCRILPLPLFWLCLYLSKNIEVWLMTLKRPQ